VVSRYFTNPTKWVDDDGRCRQFIEASETVALVHDRAAGVVRPWEYAAMSQCTSPIERALQAVGRKHWIELTYREAHPDDTPATEAEVVW
jgi:hypothetical protein